MVHLPVCQGGLSVIQGKNHSTGGWHSLSGSLVIRRRGGVSVSESACTEQLAGVDVLLYGTDRPATDVFQAQGLLEPAVVGFNAPAPVVKVGKEFGGEGLGVQERGGQHFRFPGGQRHPDKPNPQGCVWI